VFALPRLLSTTAPALPSWLSSLRLAARIVDFGPGSGTRAIGDWLGRVGFTTTLTVCGSTGHIVQLPDACLFVAARCAADMFSAGAEWESVNLDAAVAPNVIHDISDALITHGSRSQPLSLPLPTHGEPDWAARTIHVDEACLCASLLTGQPPGTVAGVDTVGHMPQDALKHIGGAMRAVANGGPQILHDRPAIIVAQGNLRSALNDRPPCHAIIIAFSIERM
jgi:hypothetical protein